MNSDNYFVNIKLMRFIPSCLINAIISYQFRLNVTWLVSPYYITTSFCWVVGFCNTVRTYSHANKANCWLLVVVKLHSGQTQKKTTPLLVLQSLEVWVSSNVNECEVRMTFFRMKMFRPIEFRPEKKLVDDSHFILTTSWWKHVVGSLSIASI